MFEYIETLKAKPGHVRERIAMGTAAGVTAIVAVGWIAVVASSGTFALAPSSVASDNAADINTAFEDTRSGFNSLLGAVGAVRNGEEPGLGIVVETESSTTAGAEERTVIPF